MQVFKFGGASVKDAQSVRNVCEILKKFAKNNTVVVISAMGKITNHLEQLLNSYFYKKGNQEIILQEIKDFHFNIIQELFPNKNHSIYQQIENTFVEINWIIENDPSFNFDQEYDQLVSIGEILSTKIVSAFLLQSEINNKWLDVRSFIKTDNSYREGNVNYALSESLIHSDFVPELNSHKIIVTQGFIGGTSENYTTTLGREGSDYTAALLAHFLNAENVTIWKDVPGVLNADPKWFKNTKKFDELTYLDAIELTYYGASVIHPKTIKPLQNKNIPLFVKSFIQYQNEGTKIGNTSKRLPIPGYIFKVDQILISIQPKDFSFIAEDSLSYIFQLFSKYSVKINVMQNSAVSFSICTDFESRKTEILINELQKQFKVLYNVGVELLTIRNYDQKTIQKLTENKTILLEQRSRNTIQIVMTNNP